MMELAFPLLCLILVGMSTPLVNGGDYRPSKNLLTFLNLLSGYYTNQDQVRFEGLDHHRLEPHDNATVLFVPIVVQELSDKITFYLEDTVNGQVVRRRIWVISEDRYGVIFVQNLQVPWHGSDKPCKSDEVRHKDFSNIRFEPNDRPECQAVFYSVDVNVFAGTILDCHADTEGEVPRYSMTVTCHSNSIAGSTEQFTGKPLLPQITFKDDSYTLPKEVTKGTHYTSPCHYE